MDLALRLREELLGSTPRQPRVDEPPLYQLVHHLGLETARRKGGSGTHGPARQKARNGQPPAESQRYIALRADDVKRLQRLAHMLASLSGELNLLLAGLQHDDEEVER
jgi:hypothetical protein